MKELRYYESTKEATLFSFRRIVETGDVRYLLILNDYSTMPDVSDELSEKLNEAWSNIYSEYSDIVDSTEYELKFSEQKRLLAKRHKITYISQIIAFVSQYPDPELLELLKDEGFTINANDADTFSESLNRAIGKLNREYLILKRSDKKEDVKEVNFDELITELERFQGYAFDEKTTTISKFASIIKRYKENGRQDKKK